MTIKNLLNHASGLVNYTDEKKFMEMALAGQINSNDDIIEFALKYPLRFTPASRFEYSNTNYVVAGRVLELVSGKTWSQFVKDNFLTPLAMFDTEYVSRFTDLSEVVGHARTKEGQFQPVPFFDLRWAGPAGGLGSTVGNLRTWCSIYKKSSILSEKSKQEMQTPFLDNYGLGIIIKPYKNQTLISHGGKTPGFVTDLGYLMESDLCVISLNNFDGNVMLQNTLLEFYSSGKTSAFKIDAFNIAPEMLNSLVGTYGDDNFVLKFFIKDGQLKVFVKGQRVFDLLPVDVDSFNLEGFAGEEFLRNEKGEVYALKHYQNGGTMIFPKINSTVDVITD